MCIRIPDVRSFKRLTRAIFSIIICTTLLASGLAYAQTSAARTFPTQSVRLIVGFVPGGGTDVSARILARGLAQTLNTQIVVENRPGAAGMIASDAVAKAEPDGHTLLLVNMQAAVSSPHWVPTSFDPITDLHGVRIMGTVPNVLVVNPETLPVASVAELLARIRAAEPGSYTYASSGLGSPQHLIAVRFSQVTGVAMEHIPYKGSGQAIVDLLGGNVHMNFDTLPSVTGHIQGQRLRALAVTTPERAATFPDVPTLAEAGIDGIDIVQWYAVLAPAGVPPDVMARLDQAIADALADPEVASALAAQGMTVAGPDSGGPQTPAAFQDYIRAEYDKYGRIARDLGATR